MTATLEQSRENLEHLVQLARAGEPVFITENGQPTVQLVPLSASPGTTAVETERPERPLFEVLDRIWAEQKARGHVPPTKEEVDRYIEEERNSWD